MRELVPIKVKIGLGNDGSAKYPDFNLINIDIRKKLDWSKYVDIFGLGWHYDKTCGHKEDSIDSPYGQQWGVLIVPKDFAIEAINKFPEVIKLTETELEAFYNNCAHCHESDELINDKILQSIKIKKDLNIPLTDHQKKALDPKDKTPGIQKNEKKFWKDFKKLTNVNILQ